MNNNNTNSWIYTGQLKFENKLKTSAGGKVFLSVVLNNSNSGMGAIMFDTVAEAFNVMVGQGNTVSLRGYISQRKDKSTGYYHNSLICNGFSVDGGASWHTEQSLKGQQQQIPVQQQQVRPPVQQSEQFQPPQVNQQVEHLQQCQQQFSQQQPQQVQQQPVQRPIEGFQDRQVQQGSQPSAQAVEAQSVLYSAPAQEQQQQPIHSEDTFDEEIVF